MLMALAAVVIAAPSAETEFSPGTWTLEEETKSQQDKFGRLVLWADELPAEAFLDAAMSPEQRADLSSGRSRVSSDREVLGVHIPLNHSVSMAGIEPADYRMASAEISSGMARYRADGTFAWSIAVASPDSQAQGMRLHITDMDLPAGVEMYVYGLGNGTEIHGPYTKRGLANTGEMWTNTVFDSMLFIELHSAGAIEPDRIKMVKFTIADVAVLGGPFFAEMAAHTAGALAAQEAKGGQKAEAPNDPARVHPACLLDIACTSDWANEAAMSQGIAHYLFPLSTITTYCSGGLLADLDLSTQRPYFLTANHCLSDQGSASGMEFFWRYISPSCGAPRPPVNRLPRSNGATLLSTGNASLSSDYSFMKLLEPAPAGSTFLGWDTAAPAAGTSLYRLSHPGGLPMNYTRSTTLAATRYPTTGLPPANYVFSQYANMGTTLGGSSGSPVMLSDGKVVGQLFGFVGPNTTALCGNDYDYTDGAFKVTYPNIQTWLAAPSGGGPVNNAFENATFLTGFTSTTSGTNVGATKEPAEPNHAGNAGGKSVWYRWKAPNNGILTVNTFGSNFDTLLAAYTGGAVSNIFLTEITSNDDSPECGATCRQSKVSFRVFPNEVYSIAVDGLNGQSGNITVNLSFSAEIGGAFADALYLSPTNELWVANAAGNGNLGVSTKVDIVDVGCRHEPTNGKYTMVADLASFVPDSQFDILYVTQTGLLYDMINSGNVTNKFHAPFFNSGGWKVNETTGHWVLLGDYNGDKKTDLAQITDLGQGWVGLAGSGTIAFPTNWGTLGFLHKPAEGRWVSSGEFGLVNPNPDYPTSGERGLTDLVTVTPLGDAWVALSNRTAFVAPTRWAWTGFKTDRSAGYAIYIGDFNGDRLSDLGQITPSGEFWVATSTGMAFNNPTKWGALGFKDQPAVGLYTFAHDWNGDGVTDMVHQTTTSEIWYSLSNGNGTMGASTKAGTPGFYHSVLGPRLLTFGKFH